MNKGVEYKPIFRGKTDDGIWIQSDCIMQFNPHPISNKDEIHLWTKENGWTKIDIETFGIYIGVEDKNETKIFTDDIVKGKDYGESVVEYRIFLTPYGACFVGKNGRFHELIFDRDEGINISEYEVVGNIHDSADIWEPIPNEY